MKLLTFSGFRKKKIKFRYVRRQHLSWIKCWWIWPASWIFDVEALEVLHHYYYSILRVIENSRKVVSKRGRGQLKVAEFLTDRRCYDSNSAPSYWVSCQSQSNVLKTFPRLPKFITSQTLEYQRYKGLLSNYTNVVIRFVNLEECRQHDNHNNWLIWQ